MSVSCKVIQDLLPLYLDGVSSKESSELVETHLAICMQCSSLKEKMAANSVVPGSIAASEKANNPLRKLKRATRKTLLISVAATFVLCGVLTAIIVYSTAGYRGIGNLTGINYDEIINQDQYEDDVRQMLAIGEKWNPEEIEFISNAQQFEHDPINNWAVFIRAIKHNEREYLCAIFANEVSPGQFSITGYEFASYDNDAQMWSFSRGGISELPR